MRAVCQATINKMKTPEVQKLIEENRFEELFLPDMLGMIMSNQNNGTISVKAILNYLDDANSDHEIVSLLDDAGIEYLPYMKRIIDGMYILRKDITSFTVPKHIETIGNCAFNGCINLSKIEIEQGVKTINDSAFLDCKKLNNVYLPDSITLVNNRAFCRCSSLIEISVGKNTQFGTGVFSASPTYKISFRGTVKECKKVLGQDHIWSSRTKSKIITCIDGKYKWERKT